MDEQAKIVPAIPSPEALLEALKRHFGFSSFRPLQQDIVRDALAGRDVFALLPTGGGKSLCFQLPAVMRQGLTIVVSPLIALMKDQVDSMTAAGISAAFLNSSLSKNESRARWRGLFSGEYRLLYVAPERLVLDGFLAELPNWKPVMFAIDEAHCISEWGHDFRPEYRELAKLRQLMPEVPIMALTATATTRVRHDIVEQLHLRDPGCYVASFNRPNLSYYVEPKDNAYEQTLEFIRDHRKESGIVYCQARKTTETVAARLSADGIRTLAYHAGLKPDERSDTQDLFIRDQVKVVCATIAFGMGIHKSNIRFIVHYDLPKNIEGYYQETGRAGRDGLPSDCLLLYSPGDVAKYSHFIKEKTDPMEQRIARQQLQKMTHYAENGTCRRVELLHYFGETYPATNCGACDNCLVTRETYNGTLDAQKLLSCVYRIRQKSGVNMGLNHVVDVLRGANTERIRRWEHQSLSTYGIGQEHSVAEWQAIGRDLIRQGLLSVHDGEFSTLNLTSGGVAALKERRKITLTRPKASKAKEPAVAKRAGEVTCDEELFDKLRELRRRIAEEKGVPPYIVFSDVSLRYMARDYPQTNTDFRKINGVGDHKLQHYGDQFLEEINQHLRQRPRQVFADNTFKPTAR